ncbi:MAG: transglutaminase domain-containing protein [Candidatus Hydrogenedentes bacterium]|nr:transglutaminase domain-containing protein [Candidatus Hydrogenedentota bacterium]
MLRRRVVILGVLLIAGFWLVMMSLLLRREVFTPTFRAERGGITIPEHPTDIWFGLLLNDAQSTPIGYIDIQTEAETRERTTGVKTRVVGRLNLNLGSFQGELVVNGESWASPDQGLRDFAFTLRSGQHATSINGSMEDGRIIGNITTGGETLPIDLPAQNTQMMTSTPGFGSFSMPAIGVGEEVLVETFDPVTMSVGKARVTCIGEETIRVMGRSVKTKVFQTDLSGMKSKAWVDAAGEVLRAETPIGFVLQRMHPNDAIKLAVESRDRGAGLLDFAAIRPQGKTPFRGAKRMRFELNGLEGITTLPSDDSQHVLPGNEIEIKPEGPESSTNPPSESDLAKALANDPFLQIEHPRIVEKSRTIVGDEPDPWKKAMLIYEWVFASVKKDIVPSLPTALDVLDTMEGDCNEHTMLYTALARAAGLPTRMAIGIVWSDEFKAYYYHAWPEVYAGRWVWIDPTLGQPVADATHIKLISGDLMSWWRIAPFMGNIKLRIIEIE